MAILKFSIIRSCEAWICRPGDGFSFAYVLTRFVNANPRLLKMYIRSTYTYTYEVYILTWQYEYVLKPCSYRDRVRFFVCFGPKLSFTGKISRTISQDNSRDQSDNSTKFKCAYQGLEKSEGQSAAGNIKQKTNSTSFTIQLLVSCRAMWHIAKNDAVLAD